LIALVTLTPILASVLSFVSFLASSGYPMLAHMPCHQIIYAVLGNALTVPIIFSSLQLFNVIRTPLAYLPNVFSSLADVLISLARISKFLTAEELDEPYKVEDAAEWGVEAEGEFQWETARREKGEEEGGHKRSWRHRHLHLHLHLRHGHKCKNEIFRSGELAEAMAPASAASEESLEMEKEKHEEEKPFGLRNVSVRIPRGAFVAVVGRVGSGKVCGHFLRFYSGTADSFSSQSSLLQALIGEMRRTSGQVGFFLVRQVVASVLDVRAGRV
jgi:ATP-binding cassette, subfamily C (CFTR/MRP), member 1